MICEILDWRCIFVSELIGNVVLAILIGVIFYFIIASKIKWGFDTTIAFTFPILFLLGLMIGGLTTIYAFATILISLLVTWVFQEIIRNR